MSCKIIGSNTPLTGTKQGDHKQIQLDSLDVNIDIPLKNGSSDFEEAAEKVRVDEDLTCSNIYDCRIALKRIFLKHIRKVKVFTFLMTVFLYIAYFSYAMYLHHADGTVTGLILVTVIITLIVMVKCLPCKRYLKRLQSLLKKHPKVAKNFSRLIAAACIVTIGVTLVIEVILVRPANLISLTGIVGIISFFFITSTHPHKVKWRPVISGLILQYMFALLILKVPAVYGMFVWCGNWIQTVLSFSKDGEIFLYGSDFPYAGMAFRIVPLIAFIMCLLTVLEHLMVLHAILRVMGRFLSLCIGASPAEALNAAANIFLGAIDSVILIRPFLDDITPSELHCLMANGMSTVAGGALGLYVMLGISPDHLLAASVMSAPAALSLSKLSVPETQIRINTKLKVHFVSQYKSVMDAASSGAYSAMTLCAAIISNITAVISIMKMVNYALNWLGELVDYKGLTLQLISSYVFYPLALSLGVDMQDGRRIAELIGVKFFINEIVAYTILGQYQRNRATFEEYTALNYTDWSSDSLTNDIVLHGWNKTLVGGFVTKRSEVIATYALCGFANFVCVGVITSCYMVLVPHRKEVIFKYVLRAMVVGHCASFMTACIAGLLYR
uniref:Sodium/nucleoside cotransporter n=1 Tax=Arion vulgaris TaxID=1028688 RepID=A0A0B7BG11_9EUPU